LGRCRVEVLLDGWGWAPSAGTQVYEGVVAYGGGEVGLQETGNDCGGGGTLQAGYLGSRLAQ